MLFISLYVDCVISWIAKKKEAIAIYFNWIEEKMVHACNNTAAIVMDNWDDKQKRAIIGLKNPILNVKNGYDVLVFAIKVNISNLKANKIPTFI